MMMAYPYEIPLAFNFNVMIPGFFGDGECSFSEVSGLTAKIETEPVIEGGVNYVHKFPKRSQYNELVLKRGILRNSMLIVWVNDALCNFSFTPMPVLISLVDEHQIPTIVWNVVNAYPIGLDVGGFKAQGNELAVETLTLAYDYFVRVG